MTVTVLHDAWGEGGGARGWGGVGDVGTTATRKGSQSHDTGHRDRHTDRHT